MSPDDNWQILAVHHPALLGLLCNFKGCTFVLSLNEAMNSLNAGRFDLVVVHQEIENCDGCLGKLRHTNYGVDTPIVVVGGKQCANDCLIEGIPEVVSPAHACEKVRQFAQIGRRLGRNSALDKKDEVIAECRHRIEELEHYLYCATHDLKSPLMTFVGYLSHIRRDLQSERHDRIPRFVQTMDNTANRMRNVINDMLELCRVGHVTLSFDQVDIGDLLQSIALEKHSQLVESGIDLIVGPDMPTVQANCQLLRQLFDNLLSNAIKYGQESKDPCVQIEYARQNGEHHFCVRDNGPGIDPEYHNKIFDLFQRLDNENGNGTGVGLTLVRRIAECHKGRAWVDSEAGKGAAFWFSIPFDQQSSEHLSAA